ncbi:MAG: Hpt domain-containing protein [Desulfosarcinaceae bacterium]|nr:Hpt domain-containing protein [Desulfosarcinaceae bacterium]
MTDLSLLQDFLAETSEHLEEMERNLLLLEDDSENKELLDEIFRSIHTIKGSSDYLGMGRIAELSHRLENLLDLMRQDKCVVDQHVVDLLIEGRDRIVSLVADVEEDQTENTEIDDLVARLDAAVNQGVADGVSQPSALDGAATHEADASESLCDTVSEQAEIENETDEELLAIFLDQLEEGLKGLREGPCRHQTLSQELIEAALTQLDSLKASANYMGYTPLCQRYDAWADDLGELKAGIAQEDADAISIRAYWQTYLKPQLVTVLDLIPNQARDLSQYLETPTFETPPEEVAAEDVDPDDAEAQLFSDGSLNELLDDPGASDSTTDGQLATEADGEEPELSLDLDADLLVDDTAAGSAEEAANQDSMDEAILADFFEEAQEHLEEMEACILALAQSDEHADLLNDIFRCVHTIKGSADYIGLTGITELSHKLESFLDHLRQGHRPVDDGISEVLMTAGDQIRAMISAMAKDGRSIHTSEELLSRLAVGNEASAAIEPQDEEDNPEHHFSDASGSSESSAASAHYIEENDTELLNIFLQQLQDQLQLLVDLTQAAEELSESVLRQCQDQLDGLNSSANYMGYTELQQVYTDWEIHLNAQVAAVNGGASLLCSTWLVEKVVPFIKSVASYFPQATELASLWEGLESAGQMASEDSNTTPPRENELLEQLGSAFDAMLPVQAASGDHFPDAIEGELFSALEAAGPTEETEPPVAVAEAAALEETLVSEQPDGIPAPVDAPAAEKDAQPPESDAEEDAPVVSDPPHSTDIDTEKKNSAPSDDMGAADNLSPTPTPRPAKKEAASKRVLRQSIRVDAGKIDALMNQVGELVVNRAFFSQLCNEMRELQHYLKQSKRLDKRDYKQVSGLTFRISEATVALGRVANELQEGVMRVRMLPIAQLFNRYPRLVHDLTRSCGKKVELQIRGEDTELDKMVIERIADPLVHIIRNAVDHGLETTAERRRMGKPEKGTLTLNAYHESNHVVIEIEDDGRGVDLERIRNKAIEKGLIGESAASQLSQREIINLILVPGFSTADTVTHTSGRGVGMDVVKKNIEKLNGTLEVDTMPGQSTSIRIKIPLTLAIIPALLVRVTNELFTIPLSVVDETLRVFKEEVSVIEGVDVMYLREETIPLIRLRDVFSMDTCTEMAEKFFVVIVNTGQKRVGLIVDHMLGQEEVVIKPLEDYLQENSGFSGATILGDGQISLILDVYELIKLSTHKQARCQFKQTPQ